MQYCKFCGTALPYHARFCRYCGQAVSPTAKKPAVSRTASYFSSDPIGNLSPPVSISNGGNQDSRLIYENNIENEEEEERRLLLGLPLLGALASAGQAPAANVPMVQGTPQVGGVPTVENSPPLHNTHWSPAHQHQYTTPAHQHQYTTPAQHLHASAAHLPTQHAQAPHLAHRQPQVRHMGARLFTVTVSSLVIVAGVITALVFLLPTSISLIGSSPSVKQGDNLHVHGDGFLPGSSVRLILDNNQPLSVVGSSTPQQTYGGSLADAAVLQVLVAGQFPASGKTIQVDLSGAFDVSIRVSQSWSLGAHTIRAIEDVSSLVVQNTQLTFQIVPKAAHLLVAPVSINFGMLKQGSKASQTVTVSNTGQQPLNWTANAGTAHWLTLNTSVGTIQPGASQSVRVTATTANLAPGNYSATLSITTGIEIMPVAVTLGVVALPTPTPTPPPPPQTCPSGLVGTPPNCYQPAPQTCPSGLVGTPPNCYQPAPQTCPSGLVGTPPNCHPPAPQHCSGGLVGTPPNCHRPHPQQPTCSEEEGQGGTLPGCYQPQQPMCPSGETGTPPYCVVPHPCTFSCGIPTCEPPNQPVPYPPYCQPPDRHPCDPSMQTTFCAPPDQPQPPSWGQQPPYGEGGGHPCEPPNQPLPYPPFCGPPQP